MVQITISLPSEIIERTRKHAYSKGATFSGIVRISLEKELGIDKKC